MDAARCKIEQIIRNRPKLDGFNAAVTLTKYSFQIFFNRLSYHTILMQYGLMYWVVELTRTFYVVCCSIYTVLLRPLRPQLQYQLHYLGNSSLMPLGLKSIHDTKPNCFFGGMCKSKIFCSSRLEKEIVSWHFTEHEHISWYDTSVSSQNCGWHLILVKMNMLA